MKPINPAKPAATQNAVTLVGKYKKPPRHSGYRVLSTSQIVHALHRQGFRHIHHVRLYKGKYYAKARGYRGPVQLTISARSGHVLARAPLKPRYGHSYYGGHKGGFSWSFSIR